LALAQHPLLPARRADALRRDLAPAAGCCAEIENDHAGLQELVLVVDLFQLVGGARAKTFLLGAPHIGIVELALEPTLGGNGTAFGA